MNYQSMLELAQRHGFSGFTALQEQAFHNPDAYDYNRDLFVMGETSSGKTLIPLLLYSAALEKAEAEGRELPKMLFVVPYRALAAQKTREMQAFFENRGLKIIQSTGEFRQDDNAVQNAQLHIAVVITEKIYKYEARDPEFLSQYDYLVLDEIGLINHSDRGIRLDFVLAWAENQKNQSGRPRIIALGTPFFDWSAYIESYKFTPICADRRPVTLDEIGIVYAKVGIDRVDGNCSYISRKRIVTDKEFRSMAASRGVPSTPCSALTDELCPMETPCRSNPELLCPVTHLPCPNPIERISGRDYSTFDSLLLSICRKHILEGHQILIFVNDRARVMQYCSFLYRELKDLLPPAPPVEICKRDILSDCELEADDVFGILEHNVTDSTEEEFYQAFKSGVAFHSAALPNELRTYVEKKLLDSRELQIVCSTETLAFGVNSSVDVVIIADLYKHEGSAVRPLSLNEFQNYAGRSGRLRPGMNSSDINGYVYTLVNKKQDRFWSEIRERTATPEKLYSLFHADQGQHMPFFLLNLLPTTGANGMTVEDLIKTVRILPQDGSVTEEETERKIKDALRFLRQQNLAVQVQEFELERDETTEKGPRYCLTSLGISLRGYILGCDDYLTLVGATEEYVKTLYYEPDKAKFLYSLLSTRHAENGLNNIFNESETLLEPKEVRSYIRKHLKDVYEEDKDWLKSCKNTKTLFILAALLSWTDGDSPKTLYQQFGLHYALLNKLAEQIAYLLEIAQAILPYQLEKLYRNSDYAKWNTNYDDYIDAAKKIMQKLHHLFISIYYGVNTKIITEVYDFVKETADEEADSQLLKELSFVQINPIVARKLRRIVIRYKFFAAPPVVDMTNIEARNNFNDQKRRYQKDIYDFDPHITAFFKKTFPEQLPDK